MQIVFVYRSFESLGIEYLSAFLKKAGCSTSLVYDPALFDNMYVSNKVLGNIFSYKKTIVRKVVDKKPRLIVFSVTSIDHAWACSIAKEIKNHLGDVPIIFGGRHATLGPDKVIELPFVDFVCIGEGEQALLELTQALESEGNTKNIPNIWAKCNGKIYRNDVRDLIKDLDTLPLPDKDLFHNEYAGFSRDYYTIITSRGCAHECTYCYSSSLRKIYHGKGKFLRKRSVDNVIEELRIAKQRYNMKMVTFFDDALTEDKAWFKEFASQYKIYIKIPCFCFVHPVNIDKGIIKDLEQMNCVTVNMGIQTTDEEYRKKTLRRFETNAAISKALTLFLDSDIFLYVDIIIGLPGQQDKDLIDAARFLNKYKPEGIFIAWLTYFPNLPINKIDIKEDKKCNSDLKEYELRDGISYNYSSSFSRIANLIIISNVISLKFLEFIIGKKIYKFFPKLKYSFSPTNWSFLCLVTIFKGIFKKRKQSIIYSANRLFYYYKNYIFKMLFNHMK